MRGNFFNVLSEATLVQFNNLPSHNVSQKALMDVPAVPISIRVCKGKINVLTAAM